jgi:hypothetical protein
MSISQVFSRDGKMSNNNSYKEARVASTRDVGDGIVLALISEMGLRFRRSVLTTGVALV